MTDDELLQLVETKSPGELSLDEIQILRARLAESAELRAAFSSRLRLQTFLAEVLARIDLAPDDVLRSESHAPQRATRRTWWKWVAVLLFLGVLGTAFGVPQVRERVRKTVHQLTIAEQRDVVDPEARPDLSSNPAKESADSVASAADPATPGGEPAASPNESTPPENATSEVVRPVKEDEEKVGPASADIAATLPADTVGPSSGDDIAFAPPPWQAALEGEPTESLESILFQRFDRRKVMPQAADLHQWFDVIVGEPKGIVEARSRRGQCGAIEGILRLKAPWTDDSILRLELEDYRHLQIHCFAGQHGVTLAFHADQPERWAAYATTRAADRFTPRTWRLTANDAERNRRTQISQGGPYQLRFRHGELLLSRGDIVLIRAPLEHLPDDVYFQGKASIAGIDWQRERDAGDADSDTSKVARAEAEVALPQDPLDVANPPANARSVPAAQLGWQSQLEPQARFHKLPGDVVRLETSDASKRSWSTIWRPRHDLHFIDLELDDATAGAGIYLGDNKNPRWVLRYVRDKRTDQLCLLARGNDDHREQDFRPLHEAMLPGVGGRHWVRLVYGPSMIRWWLSVDGIHWAEAEPLRNVPRNLTHLGLHCVAHAECGVTLRQLRLVPLTAITRLADPSLRRRALLPDLPDDPNAPQEIAAWVMRTTEFQPPGCPLDAWRRSAAVQTLAAGCAAPLGNALLNLLLDDSQARDLPLAEQLQLLDQAALLADLYENQAWVQNWVARYHELGKSKARTHGGYAFSSIRAALMRSSLTTVRNVDLSHPEAIGDELVQRVYDGDWSAMARYCRRLRFFHLHNKVPLFEWAEMSAAKRTPEGLSDELLTRMPETWRNVLIEQQSKEVYNVAAELRALLESEAFDEGARMFTALDPRAMPGVAVDQRDDRLLASLPTLMTLATQRYPELPAAVAEHQAALADLRLREQIAMRDADGVALVALQFPGTPAVADAHAWLGDRALGSGWFETALWHYRRASEMPSQPTGSDVGSRITLARTMLGKAANNVARPPRIGEIEFKIEELAALQAHRRAKLESESTRLAPNGFAGPHTDVAAPTGFAVHKKARLDGSVGQEPNRILNGNINVYKVDWADRQLALSLDQQRFYVSNRFQVAAYDLNSGSRVWQSPQLPGRVRRAHEWSLTAMRPLLYRDRIYARQLYGDTTSLVCLDKSNGQPIWNADHRQDIDIISDPVVLRDQLVCLTMARTSQLESVVRFTALDAETGTVWQERDLVTLSNAWQRRQVCEVQVIRDGLVAVLGGVVVSCDSEGKVRWISRRILLPPDEQPDWVTQTFSPARIFDESANRDPRNPEFVPGDRAYITEPGVRTVECLDVQTGQQYWSRTLPDVRRLLGMSGGCLIAHGHTRLMGLDPATGETRWQRSVDPLLHGYLCGGQHGILVARLHPVDDKKKRFIPELVWLDGKTGRKTYTTQLTGLDDPDPRLGPMFVAGGHVWTFFGRGPNDANRDVIQLAAEGPPAAHASTTAADDPWRNDTDAELLAAIDQRLPDWTILSGPSAPGTGIVAEAHGEKEVVSLAARSGAPLVLGRKLDFPPGTHPRLRLAFASDVNRPGHIEIRYQGVTVSRTEITPQTHKSPWKTIEIDLQAYAGEDGWLTVYARFANGNNPVLLAWKQLEVVF